MCVSFGLSGQMSIGTNRKSLDAALLEAFEAWKMAWSFNQQTDWIFA